jgi:hypothetical protein
MKFLKILFLTYSILALIIPYKSFASEPDTLPDTLIVEDKVEKEAGETNTLSDTLSVKYKAEKQAEKEVNKACWFGVGFGFNAIGTALAIAVPSSPDPGQFAGKSPEYIRMFTDAYKSRAREIQTTYSFMGCATAVAVTACVTLYLLDRTTNECIGCLEESATDEETGDCYDCSSAPPE